MAVADRLSASYVDGVGAPVVFIHGWLGSKDSWKQVREHLDLDNPMLFYDQRCHGASPCEKFGFDDLARDLHGLVEDHGIENPILVGHSMGGMVALTYAVRHGDVGGLVLLGTCASTPEPEVEDPQFYLDNFRSMDRERWAEMIADNYLGGAGGALRDETVRELVEADDEPVVSGLRAMIDYDVRGELEQVETDAVVVAASRDGAITDHMTEELAALLGCERRVLDSSHLLLQEAPGEVAGILEEFVQDNQ